MDGPQHYHEAESWLKGARQLYGRNELPAGQLAAQIAAVHEGLARTAAIAELNSAAGPAGDATVARTVNQAQAWAVELVPEPAPDEDGEW